MIPTLTFQHKMADLAACLPTREGSLPESRKRLDAYDRALAGALLEDVDFVEACDRILYSDQWFPTIARIVEVADECARDRRQRNRPAIQVSSRKRIVCAYCHGARWVRLGGYDALHMQAGSEGSRVQVCPRCTTNGRYDAVKEAQLIADEGGVPDPNDAGYMPNMATVTWPARMEELRDPMTGKVDMDALYRLSRELRGLDPDVDERVKPVAGWKTIGDTVRIGANEAAD